MIRRLVDAARIKLVDLIAWIDGDRTGLSDWAGQHLTPEPTPEQQAIAARLRATPLPEPDEVMLQRVHDGLMASVAAEAAAHFDGDAAAFRRAWALGLVPPRRPAAPRKPDDLTRRPSITSLDGQLALAKTVDQQLALIDELEFDVPATTRREWRRRVVAGERLRDLMARNRTPIKPYDERNDETGGSKHYADYLEG